MVEGLHTQLRVDGVGQSRRLLQPAGPCSAGRWPISASRCREAAAQVTGRPMQALSYVGYRFSPATILHTVWLYPPPHTAAIDLDQNRGLVLGILDTCQVAANSLDPPGHRVYRDGNVKKLIQGFTQGGLRHHGGRLYRRALCTARPTDACR